MLEASLQPWGFEVRHAENGAQALTLLKTTKVDLVFLDINMPVLDGPSLLRIMRSQGIEAPVVLVTSGAASPVVVSTVKLGASEFVSKPFTPQKIREVVARVLGLDLARLPQYKPLILLQCADDGFGQQLRGLIPAHAQIDAAPQLAEALDLADRKRYDAVILDVEVLEAAPLFRARQPLAGVFAVAPDSKTPARLDAPDGPLDGLLPREMTDAVVKDLLYANFLRPLVFVEASVLRVSGFEGPPQYLATYFRQLGRIIKDRAEREVSVTPDVTLDLSRVPTEPDHLAPLIQGVAAHLESLGAAAAFLLSREQRGRLAQRPELARVVLLDPE